MPKSSTSDCKTMATTAACQASGKARARGRTTKGVAAAEAEDQRARRPRCHAEPAGEGRRDQGRTDEVEKEDQKNPAEDRQRVGHRLDLARCDKEHHERQKRHRQPGEPPGDRRSLGPPLDPAFGQPGGNHRQDDEAQKDREDPLGRQDLGEAPAQEEPESTAAMKRRSRKARGR
jgi:hypothetical protein